MIPVYIVDLDQCDPKKCSGKRMEKFGLGREIPPRRVPGGSIVLSASGDRVLSPADVKHARRGVVVLDLTWTNIEQEPHLRGVLLRRLPYLVASNPINWGKPWHLNSAEAVFASLLIMGMDEQAELFLPRFNWARTFMEINGPLLEAYRAAKDADEIERIQNEYIASISSDGTVERTATDYN